MQPAASPIESTLGGMLSLEAKVLELFDACSRLEDEQPLVCKLVITCRLVERTHLRLQPVVRTKPDSSVDCTVFPALGSTCIQTCICTKQQQDRKRLTRGIV